MEVKGEGEELQGDAWEASCKETSTWKLKIPVKQDDSTASKFKEKYVSEETSAEQKTAEEEISSDEGSCRDIWKK